MRELFGSTMATRVGEKEYAETSATYATSTIDLYPRMEAARIASFCQREANRSFRN
jgi:hypothetical protein